MFEMFENEARNRRTAAESHGEEAKKFKSFVSSFWTAANSLLGVFDKLSEHEKKTWSTERPEQQVRLDLEREMSHESGHREQDGPDFYDTPTRDSRYLMITYQRESEKFVLEEGFHEGGYYYHSLKLSDGATTLVPTRHGNTFALWQDNTNVRRFGDPFKSINAIPANPADVQRFLDVLQEIDIILKEEVKKEEVKNVPLTRSLLRKLYEALIQ